LNAIKSILVVYVLAGASPSWAGVCSGAAGTAMPANASQNELEIPAAPFEFFLESPKPDFDSVVRFLRLIEGFDTTRPEVQALFSNLTSVLSAKAKGLVFQAPRSQLTVEELWARSEKLKFLNTPALRHLLDSENLQFRVGAAAWIYYRALFNKDLSRSNKIDEITAGLKALAETAAPSEVTAKFPTDSLVKITVVEGDVMKIVSDAVAATMECDHFCRGNINSAIGQMVGDQLKGVSLEDNEVVVVRGQPQGPSGEQKNLVLSVDEQKLPLREVVFKALIEAEKAGFRSLVLPALRTGYAFGAVERSESQIIGELVAAVARFRSEGQSLLRDITFAVKNNQRLLKNLEKAFAEALNVRERSLRQDIREVTLSGRGFTMSPHPSRSKVTNRNSPIYRDLLLPWDLARMKDVHAPISIARLSDRDAFSQPVVSVLNMPIKMPGSDFRIPGELAQFRELLQKMIDHEVEINPDLKNFYAYITVDHHFVKKSTTHRRGGIHIDGVQGARYKVKLPPEHTYSACDRLGTIFYGQPFDLRALDPSRQHVHAELERQARPESRIQTNGYELYFWDSYSAHEAGIAQEDMIRTFVRIEFSKKIYDGVGDTQSPMFDYYWPRVPRVIPSTLDDKPIRHQ
jgi:hypothetical protein